MNRTGVLLDRDGTIIADSGYVGSVDRVEFLDGAIEAIAALNRAGLPVAVVSNQAGVARGYYSVEDVHQVHKHMIEELARQGAHRSLVVLPLSSRRHRGVVRSSERRPQARSGHGTGRRRGARPRSHVVLGGG